MNENLFGKTNNNIEKFPITNIVKSSSLMSGNPPPSPRTKTVNYIIDSRDRNKCLYPSSSNYTIPLTEEFHDIKEIELLNVQMPKIIYTINKNNDQLKVFYGDNQVNISMLNGRYMEGDELARAVQESLTLNRPPDTPDFQVDYIKRLHKLLIRTVNLSKDERINTNGFLSLDLRGNRYGFGDGQQFETSYAQSSCGEVLGLNPALYDMYQGIVFINPLDADSNEQEISEEHNNTQSESCTPSNYSRYILRGSDIHLSDYLIRPTKTDCLTCQVDYVYLRSDSAYIPAKVISKYHCKKSFGVNSRTNLDSWIVELDNYWEITHGQFELFTDYILSENIIDLLPHKYVLLKIPRCHRFQSSDKDTIKSFAKIPLQLGEYHLANLNAQGNIKSFRPTLPLLDNLQISWIPYTKHNEFSNKACFDFAGGEHVIELAIVYYKQPLKYNQAS